MVRARVLASRKPPTSCLACLAWGVLPGRYCGACFSFAQNHEPHDDGGCGRVAPVKRAYCRLCWHQASLEAKGQVTVLEPFLRNLRHHQLFLADLQRPRMRGPRIGKQGRRRLRTRPAPPDPARITGWEQLRLVDVARDVTRFERHRVPTTRLDLEPPRPVPRRPRRLTACALLITQQSFEGTKPRPFTGRAGLNIGHSKE